jgi:plasmid stabilization system protein ParE
LKPLLNASSKTTPPLAGMSRSRLSTALNSWQPSPALARPGEVKGTRELVISPYVVVYRSTDEIVEILHIWHGAQDWR